MSGEKLTVMFDRRQGRVRAIHGANVGPLCLDGGYD